MQPENIIRLACFVSVLALMLLFECLRPRRAQVRRRARWPANFGVAAIYTALLVALPLSPLWAALQSVYFKFGLFYWKPLPLWWAIAASLLVLDLTLYWQHRLLHRAQFLWRLHRMHHTDPCVDATTALRFHPFEMILSVLIKITVVMLLGAPFLGVLIFEMLLNATAMFNHANIHLPHKVDRALRWLIVTPDMHRLHHSVLRDEHDRNFGFNLSLWDRLFGTYCETPRDGHARMQLGLREFNHARELQLGGMLSQPFR